jgi:hypothetical protein
LQRRQQKLEEEAKREEKEIKRVRIKKAQAESDKIEIMRDIATYEANACDALDVRGIFESMQRLVKQTKNKIQTLSGASE